MYLKDGRGSHSSSQHGSRENSAARNYTSTGRSIQTSTQRPAASQSMHALGSLTSHQTIKRIEPIVAILTFFLLDYK